MTTEEMKPELNEFFSKDILEYTEKLRGIMFEEYKLKNALKLTGLPLHSSDERRAIMKVLDSIIEEGYKEARDCYNEGKKIEEKHLRIAGYPMSPFIERAFKEFSKAHWMVCENYEDLKKRVSKEEEEFESLVNLRKGLIEVTIKNKSRKRLIECEVCKY